MNTCACAPTSRTSVAFAHGIVMQRCRVHELRTWTQNGRVTDAVTAQGLLKDLFVETRGTRGTARRPRAAAGIPVPQQSSPSAESARAPGADEALTALLRSRGLQGAWAVSSVA